MKDPKTKTILLHILEDLQDIEQLIFRLSKADFKANSMVKKAVCMSFLNIDEMTRELPEEFTKKHPEIPWTSIIGLRNRAAHGYHMLDDEIIWEIAGNDLKNLKKVVVYELNIINHNQDEDKNPG
jgi:uncharacterized protein with HEPN domain